MKKKLFVLATILALCLSIAAVPQNPPGTYSSPSGGGGATNVAAGTAPVSNGIWLTANDALMSNTTTQQAGPTYSIVMVARFQQIDGSILSLKSTATVTSPPGSGQNTPIPYIVPPSAGAWLIFLDSGISSGSGVTGTAYGQVRDQVFVGCGTNLSLAAGSTGTITSAQFNTCTTATPVPQLLDGYPTSFSNLCWGSAASCPAPVPTNQGFNTFFTIAAPGAGVADAVFTIDPSIRTCINSITFKLAASATIANRVVTVIVQKSGSLTDYYVSNSTQTAGQTVWYSFVAGQGVEQVMPVGTGVTIPVHTVPMGPSNGVCFNTGMTGNGISTLTVEVQGMQAADTLTTLNGRYVVWSENN